MKTVGNILITISAGLGFLFCGIAVYCLIFGYSIILFSTESMNPTIPSGSLSVVKSIPASEIKIGDIVTVNRGPDKLPVSHRVVEIHEGSIPAERVIRMKGDANENLDFESYSVTEVRRNVFSIPGLAHPFIMVFGNPIMVLVFIGAIGLLIVWRFWPSREGCHAREDAKELPERKNACPQDTVEFVELNEFF